MAGTVPYMSPEQVEARAVDHRSDIFSLGALLYEMATGQRAFQGESAAALVSAILATPPERLRRSSKPDVAQGLARVLRRCLARDPESRFQSARDVALELQDLAQEQEDPLPERLTAVRRPPTGVWLAAAAASLVLIALAFVLGRGSASRQGDDAPGIAPAERSSAEFAVRPDVLSIQSLAISPAGDQIFFVATEDNEVLQLYRRRLDSRRIERVPDSEAVGSVDASSDGRTLLIVREREGGAPGGQLLRLAPDSLQATPLVDGVFMRPTHEDAAGRLYYWRGPGSRHENSVRRDLDGSTEPLGGELVAVYEVSDEWLLGQARRGGGPVGIDPYEVRLRWSDGAETVVAPSSNGFAAMAPGDVVVYYRDGGLWARAVDLRRRRLGEEVRLLDDVARNIDVPGLDIPAGIDLASDGTLAYVTGGTGRLRELVWVSRDGQATLFSGVRAGAFANPVLSRDGRRLSFVESTEAGEVAQWVCELDPRESCAQIPAPGSRNKELIWSADGAWAIFESNRLRQDDGANARSPRLDRINRFGSYDLFIQPSDLSSPPEPLLPGDGRNRRFWARDFPSGSVAHWVSGGGGGAEAAVHVLDLESRQATVLYEGLPFTMHLVYHPSGRWILMGTPNEGIWRLEADRSEAVPLRQLGTDAWFPLFSASGDEIFVRRRDSRAVWSAQFDTRTGTVDEPEELFLDVYARSPFAVSNWSVHPNGRFLMVRNLRVEGQEQNEIVVIQDFHRVIEETVPPLPLAE